MTHKDLAEDLGMTEEALQESIRMKEEAWKDGILITTELDFAVMEALA